MRRASDVMQRDPLTIAPAMSLGEIQHLFVTAHISGAPVVDEHGVVLGMVTVSDVLRALHQLSDDDIDPAEEGDPADTVVRDGLDAVTAMDLLTPDMVWVDHDTPVDRITAVMRAEGVHRVLVGAGRQLAGIVTTFDVLPEDPHESASTKAAAALPPDESTATRALDHVLVGLDSSLGARRALDRAIRLPLRAEARLEIVTAIEEDRIPAIVAHREREAAQLLEAARLAAERALPISGMHRVAVVCEWGAAFQVLADRASHGKADLIVVGRGATRRLRDLVVGSTAERVVRNGSVSVLIVSDDPPVRYRRPLVAVDMSEASRFALRLAARVCDPAVETVDVLHVISAPSRLHWTRESNEKSLLGDLQRFVRTEDHGVRWNPLVAFGEPVQEILRASEERGVDLVAVGATGRSSVSRLLVGSVTAGVLRGATCDVLAARLPRA